MFAWILTLPASAIMASLVYVAVRWVSGFVQRSTLSEESHKFIFPRAQPRLQSRLNRRTVGWSGRHDIRYSNKMIIYGGEGGILTRLLSH